MAALEAALEQRLRELEFSPVPSPLRVISKSKSARKKRLPDKAASFGRGGRLTFR